MMKNTATSANSTVASFVPCTRSIYASIEAGTRQDYKRRCRGGLLLLFLGRGDWGVKGGAGLLIGSKYCSYSKYSEETGIMSISRFCIAVPTRHQLDTIMLHSCSLKV